MKLYDKSNNVLRYVNVGGVQKEIKAFKANGVIYDITTPTNEFYFTPGGGTTKSVELPTLETRVRVGMFSSGVVSVSSHMNGVSVSIEQDADFGLGYIDIFNNTLGAELGYVIIDTPIGNIKITINN